MARKIFATVDRVAILREYLRGDRIAAISARWGCDPSYPAVLARRLKIDRRGPDFARERWQSRIRDAERVMVTEADHAGHSLSTIASIIRRDRKTIRKILRAAKAA